MSSKVNKFQCIVHAKTALKKLKDHQESQQLCDIVLIAGVDGTRVSAHRVMLSAASDFFSAMFRLPLRESVEKEVTLGEVSGIDLKTLIHYCYGVGIKLNEDNVESLMAAASLLQLRGVVQACAGFLESNLHTANCLGIARFGQHYNFTDIQKHAEAFIHQHFMQVCESEEFFELNAEELGKILASDDLIVNSEEDIFKRVMSWIKHEHAKREKYFPELLAFVRLPLMASEFITNHITPLCKSIESLNLITEAMERQQLLPQSRLKISAPRTRPRKCLDEILLVIAHTDSKYVFQSHNAAVDKWTPWNVNLPIYISFACTVLDDSLIVVGKLHSHDDRIAVISYNFISKTWKRQRFLITARLEMGCAALLGCVYIVGGCDCRCKLNSVERWDPKLGSMTYVKSMNEPRSRMGIAVLDEYLYAIGGTYSEGTACCSVERYSPHTDEWQQRASMHTNRVALGVAAGNGYLYVVGGLMNGRCSNIVERYDPVADEWTMICSINSPRCQIECKVLGERLMAVGGFADDFQATVEEYNIETNEWTHKRPLKSVKSMYQSVKIKRSYAPPYAVE